MDYPQMMAKMWRGVAMGISTIVGLIAVYIIITTLSQHCHNNRDRRNKQ